LINCTPTSFLLPLIVQSSTQPPTTSPRTTHRCTQVILPHRDTVQIDRTGATAKYLIVNERSNASTRVVVHRLAAGGAMPTQQLVAGNVIKFDEAVYDLSGGEGGVWGGSCI